MRQDDPSQPTAPSMLEVDGYRPAVSWVTSLPRDWLTPAQRLVLLVLACDSYDGNTTAPGTANLEAWTGMWNSTVRRLLNELETAIEGQRPALIERRNRRGGSRATIRLLRQPAGDGGTLTMTQPATEPGTLAVTQPATDVGTLESSEPAMQPAMQPATHDGALPAMQPAMQPATHDGTTLSLSLKTPLTPGGAGGDHLLEELDRALPGSAESANVGAEVDRLRADGWTDREILDRVGHLAEASGVGLLVIRLRDIRGASPATKRRAEAEAERARKSAPDCQHGTPNGTYDAAGRNGLGWVACPDCRAERLRA